MDAWVDEQITLELEKLGYEDIESPLECNDYGKKSPNKVNTSLVVLQKFQGLQHSKWKDLEDILEETRSVLQENHGTSIQNTSVPSTVNGEDLHARKSPPVNQVAENGTSVSHVLSELRRQEEEEREAILREIEEKKTEMKMLISERKAFQDKLEEEQCLRNEQILLKKQSSCLVLQSHWRGYRCRQWFRSLLRAKKEELEQRKGRAVRKIQRQWRNYKERDMAARKVQTCWRHYRQRRLVTLVLSEVRNKGKDQVVSPAMDSDLSQQPTTLIRKYLAETGREVSSPCLLLHDNPVGDQTHSSIEGIHVDDFVCKDGEDATVSIESVWPIPADTPTPERFESLTSEVGIDKRLQTTLPVSPVHQDIAKNIDGYHLSQAKEPNGLTASVVQFELSRANTQISLEVTNQEVGTSGQMEEEVTLGEVKDNIGSNCMECTIVDQSESELALEQASTLVGVSQYEGESTSSKSNTKVLKASSSVWSSFDTTVMKQDTLKKVVFDLLSTKPNCDKRLESPPPLQNPVTEEHFNDVLLQSPESPYPSKRPHEENQVVQNAGEKASHIIKSTQRQIEKKAVSDEPIGRKSPQRNRENSLTNSSSSLSSISMSVATSQGNRSTTSVPKSNPATLLQHSSADVATTELELQEMKTLQESRSREEMVAQISRVRMSQVFSAEQVSDMARSVREGESYVSRLEHASSPLSPNAWAGLIEERMKLWQKSRVSSSGSVAIKHSHHHTHTVRPFLPRPTASSVSLSDAQLLSSSPRGTPLDQVTIVHLYRSRGPLTLECLSRCPKLCSLSLTKCQLSSFHNVGGANYNVKEVSLPSNVIDSLDFSQTPQVSFLDLSENRLASIHGLEHCQDLLELNLDENRIARIGGLWNCAKLQKLSVEGNLVIECSGVSCLPELQILLLGENHLPSVSGVEGCGLLQSIKLQQNNLQMCPSLTNHCLLREIFLSENCLSDVALLERAWLPLLQTLDISNNCISSIESLTCCIMLRALHLQQNNLYDLPGFLQCVRGCYGLKEVSVAGNPIVEEPKFRKSLLRTLPTLVILDGEELGQKKRAMLPKLVGDNPVYKLCVRQVEEQESMKRQHKETLENLQSSEVRDPAIISSLLAAKFSNCEEYGQLLKCHLKEQAMFDGTCQVPLYERTRRKRDYSALVIQTCWRCYRQRRAYMIIRQSAILIQSWWRILLTRRRLQCTESNRNIQKIGKQEERAAIVIQAYFRGYHLRKKLRMILSQISKEASDEEVEEEVDIVFDESLLSDEFIRPLTPSNELIEQYLSQHTSSKKMSTPCSLEFKKHVDIKQSHRIATVPKFTLPGAIEEEEVVSLSKTRPRYPHSSEEEGGSVATMEATLKTANESSSLPSQLNQKDKTLDGWGFSSQITADLMKKRVQRHRKLQKAASQKMRMQDPAERLAVFRKINHHPHTTIEPDRSMLRGQFSNCSSKDEHTIYQWSHEKKLVHEDVVQNVHTASSRRSSTGRSSSLTSVSTSTSQTTFLPELEPHVLAGHTPRLVTSSIQNELIKKVGASSKLKHNGSSTSSVYTAWN